MDNKKIGKLIAELRNKNNLTQQDLGDKIGVGFRAVSKWECGQTLPDIENMKELSKIFGITLDELIEGKLNEKKTKSSKRNKVILVISSIVILLLTAITLLTTLFNPKDKVYVYDLSSQDIQNYTITGQMTFTKDNISIVINELKFHNQEISSAKITNYEYELKFNNDTLVGYGYSPFVNFSEEKNNIKEFSKNFKINTTIDSEYKRKDFIKNGLSLKINFIDENNNIIPQDIKMNLSKIK